MKSGRLPRLRTLGNDFDALGSQVWEVFERLRKQTSQDEWSRYDLEACRNVILDGLALARGAVDRLAAENELSR